MFNKITRQQNGLLLLVLGAAAFLGSCVRADRADCDFPLRLRFSYTDNAPGVELFQEEVTSLDLFFYDAASGHLVGHETLHALLAPEPGAAGAALGPRSLFSAADDGGNTEGGNTEGGDTEGGDTEGGDTEEPQEGILEPLPLTYSLSLPPGRYDVVAWGGIRDRYKFVATHMLDEAFVYATREADSDQTLIAPGGEKLFYGTLRGLEINGQLGKEQVVRFVQNTNNIRVVVTGLTENHRKRTEASIIALNGAYTFSDNSRLAAIHATYQPVEGEVSGAVLRDFRILRLKQGDDSRLKVRVAPDHTVPADPADPDAPEVPADADKSYTIFDGSLTDLLLLYPFGDLDATSDYTIEFRVGALGGGDEDDKNTEARFSVLVNDWVVIKQDTDLN